MFIYEWMEERNGLLGGRKLFLNASYFFLKIENFEQRMMVSSAVCFRKGKQLLSETYFSLESSQLATFIGEQRCPRNTTWRSATCCPSRAVLPSLTPDIYPLDSPGEVESCDISFTSTPIEMGPSALSLNRVKRKKSRALMGGDEDQRVHNKNTRHAFRKSEYNSKHRHYNK
ncbi:hypothetical protein TNCV_110991 [Trichonephila clavipes]|nr:hypothetical protein TNCV_110991 [Trichonephila clavipes]